MDIGSYYSRSIDLFAKNPMLAFPTLIGYILIYAITFIATLFLLFGVYGFNFNDFGQNSALMSSPDWGVLWLSLGISIVIMISTWIISSMIYAATIGMSKKIISGKSPDLGNGWKYVKKNLLKILGIYILEFLLTCAACIPLIIGFAAVIYYSGNSLSIIGVLIGGLITVILVIAILVLFIFTYQSAIVGKKSIVGSLKESYKLVRKDFFNIIVVLVINAFVIGTIILLLLFINFFIGIIPFVGWIISAILSIIVYTIVFPYFTLVLTYLYMDIKDMLPEEADIIINK